METYEPNLSKGVFYALIGFFFMALFGIFSKMASADTTPLWINFLAYFTGFIFFLPIVLNKGLGFLKTQHFKYHFGRGFFGVLASLLYIYSLPYISLLNATLLFNTTPLFIPLFAIFMMGVKVNWLTWLSIFVGFIGVIIIIQPNATLFEKPGNLIALFSGITLALAYVFIKILTPTDPPLRIVFYFFLLASFLQIPFLFFAGPFPSTKTCLLAMGAGVTQILAQWFIVKAYEYAEAAKVGVFQYTSVVFVGIIDWLLWGVIPTASDYLGGAIVILAGIIIISTFWGKAKPVKEN